MNRKEEMIRYLETKLSAVNKTMSRNRKEYDRLIDEKKQIEKAIKEVKEECLELE